MSTEKREVDVPLSFYVALWCIAGQLVVIAWHLYSLNSIAESLKVLSGR